MIMKHSFIPNWKTFLFLAIGVISISNSEIPEGSYHPKQDSGVVLENSHSLSIEEYTDKVHAIWIAQMLGAIMGWPFEHRQASTQWVDTLPAKYHSVPVDDDWYYEMVALRAFEKYGINMSVEDLGKQWVENNAGTWGSSEQARLLMLRGIKPPETGHPRYNKLWWTIGPQFSSDIYGALTPGMPNLAGKIAGKYGHINGYAEGADGGVFIATLISTAFFEKDPHEIVREASKIINPKSPYRQCIDRVIALAEQGKTAAEVYNEIEDRWHIEYPATNNAVANGGIVAASVWFGKGDFLKTVNLAYGAADFSDADCNAANAASVVAAMHGMKAIPEYFRDQIGDTIKGAKLGPLTITPPVNESILQLAKRTVKIGLQYIIKNGGQVTADSTIIIPSEKVRTQDAEIFKLADLMQYWNKDWQLERAGFGGEWSGIRGLTYLDSDTLATYPRDEVRSLVLKRTLPQGQESRQLSFRVAADANRCWRLQVFLNNDRKKNRLIEGSDTGKKWQNVKVDLSPYKGKPLTIRLYQRVLIPGKTAGNAYWSQIKIK